MAGATSDVTGFQTGRYAVWTLAWWLVGVGLTRFVRGLPRGRFATWAFGGAFGILAQLAVWAVMVGVGLGGWLPAGLALALVAVFASGSMRSWVLAQVRPDHVEAQTSPTDAGRIPTSALAAWSVSSSLLCVTAAAFFHSQTLPPKVSSVYQDLYWHLGIAAELKRHVVPQVMESHTGQLNYHWLSDAFMAAGSLGAHVPTMFVSMRLWLLPVLLLTPALLVVFSRQVSGLWSSAWPAVILTTAGTSLPVLPWQGLGPSSSYAFLSPSQVFGLPMTLLAVSLIVSFFRVGSMTFRAAVSLTFLEFVCAGSKSSIVPVFLGGSVLVLFTHLVARTPQRKARRGVALKVLGTQLLALATAMPLFAGGSAGSKFRILGHLRHWDVLERVTHHPHTDDHGPFLPPGLTLTSGVVLLALVVAVLLSYGVGGFALALGRRTWRHDAAPTFIAGSFLTSVTAYLVIDHTGQSEAYFPMGAMPLLASLAAWGWAEVWERNGDDRRRWVLVGCVVGVTAGLLIMLVAPHNLPTVDHHPRLSWWMGFPLATTLLVVIAVFIVRRRSRFVLLGFSALLTLTVLQPGWNVVANTSHALTHTPPQSSSSVLPSESAAAAWVRRHTPANAMVATNVHCVGVRRSPACISSAYWTSGLMERPVFIGSWGYLDAVQRRAGQGGRPAIRQNFPDARAYQVNESMFYSPSAATAKTLRHHGVTYVFADARVARLSAAIGSYAHRLRSWGPVTVYRLP